MADKQPSKDELYVAAIKKDQEPWNPGQKVLEFAKEKLMSSEAKKPVPPTPPAGLPEGKKKGGKVCACGGGKMAKGGTASARADGCAIRGKTRGRVL